MPGWRTPASRSSRSRAASSAAAAVARGACPARSRADCFRPDGPGATCVVAERAPDRRPARTRALLTGDAEAPGSDRDGIRRADSAQGQLPTPQPSESAPLLRVERTLLG